MRTDKARNIIDEGNRLHTVTNYNIATRLLDLISDEELEILMQVAPEAFIAFNDSSLEEILNSPKELKTLCNLLYNYINNIKE